MREWHDAQLHGSLLVRRYEQLTRVAELTKKIYNSRHQLMHGVLTNDELNKLREDTVWDLVAGNKLMDCDVIVRSPVEKGRLLTASDSVIEMTKLQANMSILERPPKPNTERHMLHHLFVRQRTRSGLVLTQAPQNSARIVHGCGAGFYKRRYWWERKLSERRQPRPASCLLNRWQRISFPIGRRSGGLERRHGSVSRTRFRIISG